MIKYIREGIEEEKLEKNEELVIDFIKYINKLEESKMLKMLEKIILHAISGKKEKEIREILVVKAYDRELQTYYVKEKKEEIVRKVYNKRKSITLRKASEEVDIKKIARAYFVNTVHFIDAGLA